MKLQLIVEAGNRVLQGVLVKNIQIMPVEERNVNQDVHAGVILQRGGNGYVNLL